MMMKTSRHDRNMVDPFFQILKEVFSKLNGKRLELYSDTVKGLGIVESQATMCQVLCRICRGIGSGYADLQ